jgi:hypothetical protein
MTSSLWSRHASLALGGSTNESFRRLEQQELSAVEPGEPLGEPVSRP